MKYVVLSTPDIGKFIFLAGQKNLRQKIMDLEKSKKQYSIYLFNNTNTFNHYLKGDKLCM